MSFALGKRSTLDKVALAPKSNGSRVSAYDEIGEAMQSLKPDDVLVITPSLDDFPGDDDAAKLAVARRRLAAGLRKYEPPQGTRPQVRVTDDGKLAIVAYGVK